jgi:mono/diheme cytochrome c family protein
MTAPVYVVSHSDFQTWVTQHQTQATTAPPTTTTATAGQLAQLGQSVFSVSCAKCHGNTGQGGSGPALIGQGNSLSKYNTAQGLFNFMSSAMPLDAPGTLTHEQYLELLSYILVNNGVMQSGDMFMEGDLASVTLK